MSKLLENLIQNSIGAGFALVGFGLSQLLNYFYLKSPKLIFKVSIRSIGNEPPRGNYRVYNYLIGIDVNNHSVNDAYGFKLVKFKISDIFQAKEYSINKASDILIKADTPFAIGFVYMANL